MFNYVSLFAGIDPVAGVQPNRDDIERARQTQPAQALFGLPQDQVAISRQAELAAGLRKIADEAIAATDRQQDTRLLDKRLPELITDHRNHMAEAENKYLHAHLI